MKWSLRNNNNYEQTGLLVSLSYFANNRQQFLQNFYEKSKRSILKARTEGPAAYVLPADDRRPGAQAELLRDPAEAARRDLARDGAVHGDAFRRCAPAAAAAGADDGDGARSTRRFRPRTGDATFPAGSYIVRMDQPYSRIADALLDYQYWSPNDPQKTPYDDTGLDLPRGLRGAGRSASPTRRCSTCRWRV